MLNKDVTHPRMRRLIKNPRIVLLDCSLEYKKGESQVNHRSKIIYTHISSLVQLRQTLRNIFHSLQTDIEITREEDFSRILQMEEEYIQQICEDIIRIKPDLVFTEKGVSGTHTNTHMFWSSHTQNSYMLWSTVLALWCDRFLLNLFPTLDLAQHYLMKANITAIRRVRKTDNNRIAR